jgi:peptidoglycan/LPS O-acetylase OafA/YrhL
MQGRHSWFDDSQLSTMNRLTSQASQQQRYHSFDCLRAGMMMMGIWMHGVQCYTELKVYMWPFKDVARSQVFDFTINWVHIFRMPVFFAMAGFFFALLTSRRGVNAALLNRVKRILLPFILGWAVLAPVIIATIGYLGKRNWADARALVMDPAVYWKYGPLHLWFLEYLLLLYPLMLGVNWLVRRALQASALATASRLFRWSVQSRWRALLFALLAGGPMASMGGWLTTPGGFQPNPRILLVYFLFFGFGWVLYFERDVIGQLRHGGWVETAAGVCLAGVGHAVLVEALPARLWCFAGPLATWFCIFGFISLSLRYLERPVAWLRYLSDSSYWLYLIHVPVLLWVQVLLAPTSLPVLLKGVAALGIAMPLMLLSYHFAVRPTWLGLLLNGHRYPRAKQIQPEICRIPPAPAS